MRFAVARSAALRALLAHASLAVVSLLPLAAIAQVPSTQPPPGIRENTPSVHALINARIVMGPGRVIARGTLVMRDGEIEAVGAAVQPPGDAVIHDMQGKTLYPGLIDAYTELGKPGGDRSGDGRGRSSGASYWNPLVTPQVEAGRVFVPDSAGAKTLRDQGVTVALTAPSTGIIKGRSAIVNLGTGAKRPIVLKTDAALHVAISVPLDDNAVEYPTSPMGAYTLVRQAFYDADWYARAQAAWQKSPRLPRPEVNQALEALRGYAGGSKPVVVDTDNELYSLRADRLGKEFGLNVVLRGNGREYRQLDAIRASGRPILLPVDFPTAPAVETPEEALAVELEDLLHWDLAPENPGRLARSGVRIALTSDGLKDQGQFLKQVRRAVERGLDRDEALRALTVTPAALFGLGDKIGTLDAGKLGNVVVTDGDLFASRTRVLETWIEGRRYPVRIVPKADPRGTWQVALAEPLRDTSPFTLRIAGEAERPSGAAIHRREATLKSARIDGSRLALSFSGDSLGWRGIVRMSATVSAAEMMGEGEWPDGKRFEWSATRSTAFSPPADTAKTPRVEMASFPVIHPLATFGRVAPPEQPDVVVFRGATVWTCGPKGRIDRGTVIVRHGKISAVGRDLAVPAGARIVEAAGKHITPGIIDCHSHIATDGGVNEAGQTISAEVRIGDFIDPNDVSIYRQLAGGVTAAHVLHGSANAIGGQCQLVKLRWGAGPEAMKFAGWTPTIKFALGENVKQSNWGERFVTRYPQTRMGVEQLLRDEFQAARDYQRAWAEAKNGTALPPRRDLELDAMVEVLEGKRLIHCHSYRQDEILMLMRVCDDFGVHIACFQHILEGYKVADEMAKRGIGGSCFSDWWGYKVEVQDAIPYAGAIMHQAGILVSFNSDSDELARRLNTEAAKAMKYGGISEEEALKFVTLNPAKQLRVDDRVGSVAPGMDADLAIWSGDPLSSMSRCEQTWIDGRKYFDRQEDERARAAAENMRAVLVQKILRTADRDLGKDDSGSRKATVRRGDVFAPNAGEEEQP